MWKVHFQTIFQLIIVCLILPLEDNKKTRSKEIESQAFMKSDVLESEQEIDCQITQNKWGKQNKIFVF